MNRKSIFTKTKLVASISLILGAGMLSPAYSAEEDTSIETEEQDENVLTVTGIRGSLISSMNTKRDGQGVVDAITAEDIGKFPDTNLAESLQRISGVSIDRQNGEGSKVTVRGFGPDYNLVTLNGRQMPTSNLEDTGASDSRSFDFANLASESVSAVEVYKTNRADIATGGIGSTINIITARPLNTPGMIANVGIKGVMDQSTEKGSNITPEISGIYSNTTSDKKFGVRVTGSYQERHSGSNEATVGAGWRTQSGYEPGWGSLPENSSLIENRPGANDVYAVPQNLIYGFDEIQRTRTNGQLALQYRPIEKLTATLDYTYSENEVASQRSELSTWFGFDHRASSWTDGPVAAPIIYSENNTSFDADGNPTGYGDIAMAGGSDGTVSENKSKGFNLEYEVNDNLELEFDVHSSTAESKADSPYGSNATLGTAAFIRAATTIDFSQDFPVMQITYPEGVTGLDASQMVTTGSSLRNSYMKSEIDEFQLKGLYVFDDGIVESINFGIGSTEVNNRSAFSVVQRDTWGGVGSPSDFDPSAWILTPVGPHFDGVSGSNSPNLQPNYFDWDFDQIQAMAAALYGIDGDPAWPCGSSGFCASDDFTTDRYVNEDSMNAHVQVNMSFEIGQRPASLVAGLRYEKTDVTSRALAPVYESITWVSANEFSLDRATGSEADYTQLEGNYNYTLPSLDFNIEIVDDVILRASYSETIGRPGYGAIQGGLNIQEVRINGGTGSRGNPALLPLESQNIDLSAEWYYDIGSYASIGFFQKNVDNFIGAGSVQESVFDLAHPAQGPWLEEAIAAGATTNDEIRQHIYDNHSDDPNVFLDANGIIQITGSAGIDNLAIFDISIPVNEQKAKVDGVEIAIQHVFGDSGWGGFFNYTYVDNNRKFDNAGLGDQFALEGDSDTANLMAFYDNNGIQARLAYNWRGEYLDSTRDGSGANPIYVESYGQWDTNVSYEVDDNFTVFFEGINITNEIKRSHGRGGKNMLFGVYQSAPRYNIGARYTF